MNWDLNSGEGWWETSHTFTSADPRRFDKTAAEISDLPERLTVPAMAHGVFRGLLRGAVLALLAYVVGVRP